MLLRVEYAIKPVDAWDIISNNVIIKMELIGLLMVTPLLWIVVDEVLVILMSCNFLGTIIVENANFFNIQFDPTDVIDSVWLIWFRKYQIRYVIEFIFLLNRLDR